MKLFILLYFIVGLSIAYGLGNLVESVFDIFKGTTPRSILSEMLRRPLNTLKAIPLTMMSDMYSKLCSMKLEKNAIRPEPSPNIKDVKLVLRSACQSESYALSDADKIAQSSLFDIKKRVVIYSSGWTTTVNDSGSIEGFAKAYNCRGDTNFVALDVGYFIDTLYTWAAFNTETIGGYLAVGINKLTKVVPIKNIHLMGHSLGAHIMGSAARHFHNISGELLPHVTGLDPAKPCFKEGGKLTALRRGDAEFVDIIHSNPGMFGIEEAIGDVDYYPDGLLIEKIGCFNAICSHQRAVRYYIETVYPGHSNNFLARRCSSLNDLRSGQCNGEENAMGYGVSHDLRGMYISAVKPNEPYGPNAKYDDFGTKSICGSCLKMYIL